MSPNKRFLLIATVLSMVAACSPKTATAPPSATETMLAHSTEPTSAPTAAGDTKATYHVYDNGVRCITFPCPSWSAIDAAGKETKFTEFDLSALKLDKTAAAATQRKLSSGYEVRGTIGPGAKGPAGEGTQLKVFKLLGPKPKK